MANKLPPRRPDTPLKAANEQNDSRRVRRYSAYWCAAFALNVLILFLLGGLREWLLGGIAVCFGLLAWMILNMEGGSRLLLWSCAVCCLGISILRCLIQASVSPIIVLMLVAAEITAAISLRSKF